MNANVLSRAALAAGIGCFATVAIAELTVICYDQTYTCSGSCSGPGALVRCTAGFNEVTPPQGWTMPVVVFERSKCLSYTPKPGATAPFGQVACSATLTPPWTMIGPDCGTTTPGMCCAFNNDEVVISPNWYDNPNMLMIGVADWDHAEKCE